MWSALKNAQYKENASSGDGGDTVRVARTEDSTTNQGLLVAQLDPEKADDVIARLEGVGNITDTQLASGVATKRNAKPRGARSCARPRRRKASKRANATRAPAASNSSRRISTTTTSPPTTSLCPKRTRRLRRRRRHLPRLF